ncbi:MAG: TOBE domain-containing protein, partial [Alphaproteobacteria bacterium]
VRPEALRLGGEGLAATVLSTAFHGAATRVVLEAEGGLRLVALLPKGAEIPAEGARVHVSWAREDLHLMEEEQA